MSDAIDTLANFVGLGNPAQGAPTVAAPDPNAYVLPKAEELNAAAQALGNNPDLQAPTNNPLLQQVQAQGQQINQQYTDALQPGAQSPANMKLQTDLQGAQAKSLGAVQSQAAASNPGAAVRVQQQAQAQGQAQAIAQGAAARAQEEETLRNQQAQLLGQLTQGAIAGESQRLQAARVNQQLQLNSLNVQTQVSRIELQSRMQFAEQALQYSEHQQSVYLQAAQQAEQNRTRLWGILLQTAGTVGGAYLRGQGVEPKPKTTSVTARNPSLLDNTANDAAYQTTPTVDFDAPNVDVPQGQPVLDSAIATRER